jgi:hypothetical protein
MSAEAWELFVADVRCACRVLLEDEVSLTISDSHVAVCIRGSNCDTGVFNRDGTPDQPGALWSTCKTNHIPALDRAVRVAAVLYAEHAGAMGALSCDYRTGGMLKWMEAIDAVSANFDVGAAVSPAALLDHNVSRRADVDKLCDLEVEAGTPGRSEFAPGVDALEEWALKHRVRGSGARVLKRACAWYRLQDGVAREGSRRSVRQRSG